MGVIAKYVKQAAERKRYQIRYANWLDMGEGVANVTFAVDKVTVPPLVADNMLVGADGTTVQYYVSGGLDGTDYVVTATLTTNTTPSQIKEDEIFVSVRGP